MLSSYHVSHFLTEDICAMVKEFKAILGLSGEKGQSVIPQLKHSYVKDPQSLIRLLPSEANKVSNGKTINFSWCVVSC